MNRQTRILAAALLMAAPAPLAAQDASSTAQQQAANEAASALGERLYWHDRAAMGASALLTSALDLTRFPELRGYVTEEDGGGAFIVTFYTIDDAGAYFDFARFEMGKEGAQSSILRQDYREFPLSGGTLRLAMAREAALAQGAREQLPLCMSSSANFITLSNGSSGQTSGDVPEPVSVYILSSPTIPGRYPIGGHYMFSVDHTNTVIGGRAFADRCLDVPVINRNATLAPDNYTLSHALDPQPNAIHHFVARQMNLPLVVSTGETSWTLDYRKTPSE